MDIYLYLYIYTHTHTHTYISGKPEMLPQWSQQVRQLTPRRGTVALLGNRGRCAHIHTGHGGARESGPLCSHSHGARKGTVAHLTNRGRCVHIHTGHRGARESGSLCSHSNLLIFWHGARRGTVAYLGNRGRCVHIHTGNTSPLTRAPYMLNTWNKENHTVFYSHSACFVNTFTLHTYVSMAYTGLPRRNTVFTFVWLRHRSTWISVQHAGRPLMSRP